MNSSKPNRLSRNGVYLGRFLRIDFYLDFSWFVIAVFLDYMLTSAFTHRVALGNTIVQASHSTAIVMGAVGTLLYFASILLHELGHSVVSQRCGIPVPRITLFLFGGVAEIAREPDDAKSELKIALGGPAVSAVLIVIYGGVAQLFLASGAGPAALVSQVLAEMNLFLVLFNLIPGYPLDGGRVLRALLWAKTGKLRWATFVTSRIGIGFAWLLIIVGFYTTAVLQYWNGLTFFLIAFFLKNAAERGYANALQREVLGGVKVRDIMTARPIWIPARLPLNLAVDEFFFANHHVAFPVGGEDGEFRGLLRIEFLKDVPREKWPYTTTGDVVAARQAEKLCIEAESSAARAMRLLLGPGLGRLAVTDMGKIVGIITRHDILHFIRIHTELEE